MPNVPDGHDLLTTGEAAALLGASRQHVVDLCDRGKIPFRTAGAHRRLRRRDIEKFSRSKGAGRLRREETRSLWLNRAVAGKLVQDPNAVLAHARTNLARFVAIHPDGMSMYWLRRWRELLDGGAESVLDALTSPFEEAVDLRQNSPFAGVLSEEERRRVLAAFAENWKLRVAP